MSRLIPTTRWEVMCACGNYYGDTMATESQAILFIREYPNCADCDLIPETK